MGITRDWKEVRGAYQLWKMQAKRNFTAHKRSLCSTGGGPYASELSPFDEMLKEIVPEDFAEDENMFDCDAIFQVCHKLSIVISNLQNKLGL